MSLAAYRTLGCSGLVVSPLTLGTMTFGVNRWGSDEAASRAVFDAYIDAGGNAVDTADIYAGGRGEEMVGACIAARTLRERVVLATKAGFNRAPGNPNAGGNGAKNIRAALEGSLRRLQTDYIDLFWVHVWDGVTLAEDVLQTLGDLVRAGKIRYFGLSNAPAWYVARMATLATAHGVPGPIALQMEYSLSERGIEREHVPAARALGLGVVPWSPLSGGFLSGKYDRATVESADRARRNAEASSSAASGVAGGAGNGRLAGSNPFGDAKFTPRNWDILDALKAVAVETGRSPAQVALAWAAARPGVASLLLGASTVDQLLHNMAALDVALTPAQAASLDAVSAPDAIYPYTVFTPEVRRMVFGGADVGGWPAVRRGEPAA